MLRQGLFILLINNESVANIFKNLSSGIDILDKANLKDDTLYPQMNSVLSAIASENGEILKSQKHSRIAVNFLS